MSDIDLVYPSTKKSEPLDPSKKNASSKSKKVSHIASKQVSHKTSHMTILQFTDADYEKLREPAYKSQTFRLSHDDVLWFRDTAHELDKKVQRGKVTQADILKLCKKIFENLLQSNQQELIKILKKFK